MEIHVPGTELSARALSHTLAPCLQVLMVRFASLFDVKEQTVTFMSRTRYGLEELWAMGMGDLLGAMFDFSEKLSALELSDEELGLFTAVVLVSAGGYGGIWRGLGEIEGFGTGIRGVWKRMEGFGAGIRGFMACSGHSGVGLGWH